MEQLHSCHGHVGVIGGPDWMLMHFVLLQWLHGATWGLEFRVRNILKTKQGWFLPTYQVYKCNLSFACWLFSALILTVAVLYPNHRANLGLESPGWWTVANNNSSQLPTVTTPRPCSLRGQVMIVFPFERCHLGPGDFNKCSLDGQLQLREDHPSTFPPLRRDQGLKGRSASV